MLNRALAAYAGGITAALCVVLLTGTSGRQTEFNEISVNRLNVLEPDGTVRMVISGREDSPGLYAMNEHHERADRPAGLYFMNDEGTEVGGLIFSGERREDGRPFSMVHFSMDNYNQDQALVLRHIQDEGTVTGLMVNDVPSVEYDYDALAQLNDLDGEERRAAMAEIRESGVWDSRLRMFAGRGRNGDATIYLNDAEGRHRFLMAVTETGEVKLQLFDEEGQMTRDLLAD
jgi:hypothetical protein